MRAIRNRRKVFLLRPMAALAILSIVAGTMLTSLPAYANDGAAVAAVAAPAAEATDVEATAVEAEVAPAVEAEAAPAAEATDVEATAVEAEVAPAVEAEAAPAAEATDVEATAVEAEVAPAVEAEAAPEVDTGTATTDAFAPEADTTTSDTDTSAPADASIPACDTEAPAQDITAPEVAAAAPADDVEATAIDDGVTMADTQVAEAPIVDTMTTDAEVASVSTGQSDYMPGSTVDIAGEGFAPNAEVTVTLTKPDGSETQWMATTDDTGTITTTYELTDGIEGAYFVWLSDGNNTAATLFTDPVTVLSPNGNGAVRQLSDYPSAGSNWQKVDDATPDGDETYVYTKNTSTAGRGDLYAIGNLTDTVKPEDPVLYSTSHTPNVWSNNPVIIMVWDGVSDPGSLSADSVTVKAFCRTTAATPGGSASVGIKPQGGAESWATAETLGTDYSQFSSEWTINPATGQPWTYADINNLQAGVTLRSPSSSSESRSTMVWLEVDSDEALASGVSGYRYEWNDSTPDLWMANQGTGVEHTVTQTLTQGTRTFYVYAKDNAGNNSATISSGPYKIDLTAPTLSTSSTPRANSYGWNKTDVTAKYTAKDTLSGLATPSSGSHVFTDEGANQSTTFTATDNAGNTTTKTVTVNIDKTKPTITGSPSPTANSYGWNNTDVIVHFTGSDALSGIATVTPDVTISSEGTNKSATGTATDKAGNRASTTVRGINIDKTAPTVTGSPDRPAIYNGWYNGPVTISWKATDARSKVNPTNPGNDLAPDTVSNEGIQIATATAYDYADNMGTGAYTVKIDQSSPTVTGSPDRPANIHGWYNGPVTISWKATDALSGVNYSNPGNDLAPDLLSAEGSGQTATAKAYDYVNNMGTGTHTVNIDTQAPTVTGSPTTGPTGAHGWYNAPVDVLWNAKDNLSGFDDIGTLTTSWNSTITTQGTNVTDTQSATDWADNTGQGISSPGINTDWTQPTLVKDSARTGTSEITVTLTGADALSGVDFIRYSTDGGNNWTTVNSDTTTFTLTGIGDHNLGHLVFDIAGNEYALADQTLTIDAPGGGGTGTTGEAVGTVASLLITSEGELLEDIVITSPDGVSTLNIPAGTWLMNPDGTPVTDIDDFQILPIEGVTAPDGYQLIGSAYQFTPSDITFAPDATPTISYDPAAIPEGSTLVIAYFDEATGTWVELPTTESAPGFLTAPAGGGHTFAIFAK